MSKVRKERPTPVFMPKLKLHKNKAQKNLKFEENHPRVLNRGIILNFLKFMQCWTGETRGPIVQNR